MSKVLKKTDLLSTKNLLNMSLLDFLSHELKTPLSTLRLNIEVIKQTLEHKSIHPYDKNIKLNQLIKIMDIEVEAMIQLISDMLELRQVDAHTILLKQIWCPWNEIMESAQNRMATLSKKNKLKVQTDKKITTVYADPALCKQVLLNLISNAIEHSPENSTIEVSSRQSKNNNLTVSIRDQGPGIETSEQNKIFMPFYKKPKSTTFSHNNSGLGLSIAKRIIEAHGGMIKAINHPNGGAILTFTLPQPKE